MDASTRKAVLTEYHNAGIALMVSAFGSTGASCWSYESLTALDSPTSDGTDPTAVAKSLAQFVIEYGLDGVDIDYEGKIIRSCHDMELITHRYDRNEQQSSRGMAHQ